MTTTNKEFADNVARNNGYYNGSSDNTLGDNPRVVRIVKYTNMWDGESYGLILAGEYLLKYDESAACRNCQTYWEYDPGISSRRS
jgi:hypothetical protein